ncbi:hypothetical protein C8Q77DRAFT_1161782 [Trametes polyzona]|nr:hypothetical protein C8Q77DRAFT_1161782 [Trametes polyzona]
MATVSHSVVIVGGTGGVGRQLTRVFLSEYRANFPDVRVLTRDPSSAAAQELAAQGAALHKLDESDLAAALDGAFARADVVVNVLQPADVAEATNEGIVEAARRNAVKVYFLSEFGTEYRVNDFPGYEHPYWTLKQKLAAWTRERLHDCKVIAVYTSGLLDFALSPFMGVDVKNNVYSCYGAPSQRISATSTEDVGRSVARLALLALDPATAAKVPDEVRTEGSTASYEEIRDIVARVKGVPKGEIRTEDIARVKERLRQSPGKTFIDLIPYIRVVVGQGRADFSSANSNELINPGETLWKWRTIEDHVREA